MDERGVFTFHTRLRDVIIRAGENIYPAEVEDVLLGHPAIAEVAVVGVADERWGEVPVAFVRLRPDMVAGGRDLEEFARRHLASFKVPRRWIELDEFPVTAVGKVKKFELRQLAQHEADAR
jgi:acyl-CoA synthetase (AMP-forming)/AMP-acid ligase II